MDMQAQDLHCHGCTWSTQILQSHPNAKLWWVLQPEVGPPTTQAMTPDDRQVSPRREFCMASSVRHALQPKGSEPAACLGSCLPR